MILRRTLLASLCVAALALPLALQGAAGDRRPADLLPVQDTEGDAWLGVYLQDVTRDIAESLDLDDDRGALVSEVIDDSPAEDAGIRNGDVIISIDGDEVSDPDELIRLVRRQDPGDRIRLEVVRDGETREFTVRLTERPSRLLEPRTPQPGRAAPGVPKRPAEPEKREFKRFRIGPSAFLGVRVVDMNGDLAEYFDRRDRGALVILVEEGSPAAEAGLKAGDIITGVSGRSVEKADDLIEAIREADEGDRVEIEFVRRGAARSVEARLDEAPGGLSSLQMPRMRERMFRDLPRIDRNDLDRQMDELRRQLDDLRRQLEDLRERND